MCRLRLRWLTYLLVLWIFLLVLVIPLFRVHSRLDLTVDWTVDWTVYS